MTLTDQIRSLNAKLEKRIAKLRQDSNASVIVGFSTDYATFVHEDLTKLHGSAWNAANPNAKYRKGSQECAKFLERACRELRDDIISGIKQDLLAKLTLSQALLRAGLKIQSLAQYYTPVDTGVLRNSASTRLET